MKFFVISILLLLPVSSVYAQGKLFLANNEGKVHFDESRYPAELKGGIAILNKNCETCHSLARVINAIETGQTMSGSPFNESSLRQFVIRKKRLPDANLSGKDAAELLKVLQYLLNQNVASSRSN